MTKAEKHFETLKDTSLPLPIWYQDGLTNQWKSRKLILQGKGYACFSPDGSNELTCFLFGRFDLRGPPTFKLEMKQEEEIPTQAMAALKISKNTTLDVINLMISLLGRQIKTLTN